MFFQLLVLLVQRMNQPPIVLAALRAVLDRSQTLAQNDCESPGGRWQELGGLLTMTRVVQDG